MAVPGLGKSFSAHWIQVLGPPVHELMQVAHGLMPVWQLA